MTKQQLEAIVKELQTLQGEQGTNTQEGMHIWMERQELIEAAKKEIEEAA